MIDKNLYLNIKRLLSCKVSQFYLGVEVCVAGLALGPGCDLLLDDGPLPLLQRVPGHGDDVQRAPDGDLLQGRLLVLVLSHTVKLRVDAAF